MHGVLQVSSARKTGVKSHDGVIIESASIIFNVSEFRGTRMMQYVNYGKVPSRIA